jgi:DNA polymerase-3 subunit epsilon
MTRKEMAGHAPECECQVMDNVTCDTTILLVGDQDIERLMGYEKSSKQRKAEALIERGKEIKILTESDFMSLLKIV